MKKEEKNEVEGVGGVDESLNFDVMQEKHED